MTVAERVRETIMSAQGSTAARKLFGIELPEPIAKVARKIEGTAQKAIVEERSNVVEPAPVVGYFDDQGTPRLAVSKGAEPALEDIAVELVRLVFRNGRFEKNMPFAEMRHEANRRLCRRLYRIIESEVVFPEAEGLDVRARNRTLERMRAAFLDPLQQGRYRPDEAGPARVREGVLDALELTIAEHDARAAERHMEAIAAADPEIARALGMLYTVVKNHRPFEDDGRVRAAYYLAVPFLFDARRPGQAPPRR